MSRGFDYKKRRDWPARGARREWPPLNPQPEDPTTITNIPTTIINNVRGVLRQTYVGIRASGITIPTGVSTTIASTDFAVSVGFRSADHSDGDWLDGTADSFRWPRAGAYTMTARVQWDADVTGSRQLEIAAGVFATILRQPATDTADQSLSNTGFVAAGDHADIGLFQDSGVDRVVDVSVFVVYTPILG